MGVQNLSYHRFYRVNYVLCQLQSYFLKKIKDMFQWMMVVMILTFVDCSLNPTYSNPINMQTNKIDIYTTTATNVIAQTFSTNFATPLISASTGNYTPVGFIAMCTLDFTPSGSQAFSCNSQTISTTSLTISCTIDSSTTINKLSYYYFVLAKDSYLYLNSGLYSYILATEIDVGYADLNGGGTTNKSISVNHGVNGTAYLRGLVFFRGIQFVTGLSTFTLNLSMTLTAMKYIVVFTVPTGFTISSSSITKVCISLLIYDVGYFMITLPYSLEDYITIYKLGTLINTVPVISTSGYWYVIGLRSLSIVDANSYSFSFINSGTGDINFPISSSYNQVQYFSITQMSCTVPTFLERGQKLCQTGRNGCTTYYQYITNAASSQISAVYMHSSMKIFAFSSAYQVKLYRHNGANFIFFTSFYLPIQSSKIIRIELTPDFSRIAILCNSWGFFIYRFDGTAYVSQYMLPTPSGLSNYLDFSIKSDFKLITIIYSGTGAVINRITLVYNNANKNYTISTALSSGTATNGSKIFVNYIRNQAYMLNNQFIDHLSYDTNFQLYAPYASSINISNAFSATTITSAMSGDGNTLAMDYTRNMGLEFGIKIFQYNTTSKMFIYSSSISSVLNQNFGIANTLKLSYNGLKLLVKSISGSVQSRLIFTRTSISSSFILSEIIGNHPESVQTYSKTLGIIDATDNFQSIISSDGKTNVVVYYCLSSIPSITTIYQIPIAPTLYTDTISPTDQKINNLTQKLDNLTTFLTSLSTNITQINSRLSNLSLSSTNSTNVTTSSPQNFSVITQKIDELGADIQSINSNIGEVNRIMNILLPVVFALLGLSTIVIIYLIIRLFQKPNVTQIKIVQKNQPINSMYSMKQQNIPSIIRTFQNSQITINQQKSNNSRAAILPEIQIQNKDTLMRMEQIHPYAQVQVQQLQQVHSIQENNTRKRRKKKDNNFIKKIDKEEIDQNYQNQFQVNL